MSTELKHRVPLEEIQRVLTDSLGPTYRVTVTSANNLRVYRNPVIWARVRVGWSGEATTVRVVPGGFFLLMALNALYTAPKVRHAIERGFADASWVEAP